MAALLAGGESSRPFGGVGFDQVNVSRLRLCVSKVYYDTPWDETEVTHR